MDLKRKAYQALLGWKQKDNHKPLIVEGQRQVGKSYIVLKFAQENYENVIVYDFRHNSALKTVFKGNLDVDTIISNSSIYFPGQKFVPNKTCIIFEEIGDCPKARTSLKSFALDGRFDVIATGSLLGIINYRREKVAQVPIGYEEFYKMKPLDFEEFLWANNVNESVINILKECLKTKEPLSEAIANPLKEYVKRYIAVGGMPQAVNEFLNNNGNYIAARNVQEQLVNEYKADFGRIVDEDGQEFIDYKLKGQIDAVFDSIPIQLARENNVMKFKYSNIQHKGRSETFENAFDWLEKAGLILRAYNVKAVETPLKANADLAAFKVFFSDIGLLMSQYPISTLQGLINDTLDSKKGAIFENLAACHLTSEDLPLYYYSNNKEHLEIDFLIEGKDGIILYEEKSVNGKMNASKTIMEGRSPYKAAKCYKIIRENFGVGDFYETIPEYGAQFLLQNIKASLMEGLRNAGLNKI